MTTSYPEILIIVGSGRSGTTYLRRMLGQALDFGLGAEPKFVAKLYQKLEHFGDLSVDSNLRRLVEAVHNTHMFHHLHNVIRIPSSSDELMQKVREPTYTSVLYAAFELMAEKRGKSHLCYRDPQDLVHLPLLAELMPTAIFLHIVRDGRDVALSLQSFRWGATNLYAGARFWHRVVSKGHGDGLSLGKRYFAVRMEDLVTDTENCASAISDFVMRSPNPETREKLANHITETKMSSRIYRWQTKLTPRQRLICESACRPTLRMFDYPVEYDDTVGISTLTKSYFVTADFFKRATNRLARQVLPKSGKHFAD